MKNHARLLSLIVIIVIGAMWVLAGYIDQQFEIQENTILGIAEKSYIVGCVEGGQRVDICKFGADLYRKEFKAKIFNY